MKKLLYSAFIALMTFGSTQAHAVDGCKVLLCMAGDWRNISQCRPEVEAAFRDVARGHAWPTCGMSGASNSASFGWISEAECPAFYQDFSVNGDTGNSYYSGCRGYDAVIRVQVQGASWLDMFWSFSGQPSSTRYYAPARTALGSNLDPKYDTDAAAYVPPPLPPQQGCSGDSC